MRCDVRDDVLYFALTDEDIATEMPIALGQSGAA